MGITQITTVKGRKSNIYKNLKNWLNSGIDQLVLVDYACPEQTGRSLLSDKLAKDPRITLLIVGSEVAGPFYQHGRARNVGAQAARFETLLFVDADTTVGHAFVDKVRFYLEEENLADVVTSIPSRGYRIDESTFLRLPSTWALQGQVAIKNAAYYGINGFCEQHNRWGAETHDLVLRAQDSGMRIKSLDVSETLGMRHQPHTDDLRTQYLAAPLLKQDKGVTFESAVSFYNKRRRQSFRAQPGRALGMAEASPFVRMFKGGVERSFNPGEDF